MAKSKLLKRRYMRKYEEVSRTEKLIGMFILVLTAGIVAAFAYQVKSNRNYLFNVDPQSYEVETDRHELAVARAMLPEFDDPRWQPAAAARVMAKNQWAEELPHLAPDLTAFEADWVYYRRYASTERPQDAVDVMLCDMGTPARAFGLCRQRRSVPWEPLSVGRDGWRAATGEQAGLWNGRYYTELRRGTHLLDPASAFSAVAEAIAGRQLEYRGEFAADALLPTAGRVSDTFRYVHAGALGIAPLREAFLVDLEGELTAWVVDAQSDSGAGKLLEQIRRHAASVAEASPSYGHDQPASEVEAASIRYIGPLTVLPINEAHLAVFTAGRYVYGTYGPQSEDVVGAARRSHEQALASLGGEPADGASTEPPAAAETAKDSPFPEPGIPDWESPQKASRFTPDNLYVKINGRADVYLQFHVVSLTFGTYRHETGERTIDVYWYDMGEPQNAMGIYRAEAPPDPMAVPVGREGYTVGGAVFFRKGSAYVQILPMSPDEADRHAARQIAESLDAGIEEEGDDLWALDVLPAAGRVADSLAYLTQDVFSLDFLSDVYTARYERNDTTLTLFVHRAADADTAGALFDRYLQFFEKYGQVTWRDDDPARRIAAGEVAGVVDVVFVRGRYLGGVSGADQFEPARTAATSFYDILTAP